MANKVMGYVICGYNSVDNLMSEQSSPFRRWTTGSGAGSSYRHQDYRNMYNKQMSEGSSPVSATSSSNVARWSLGLEHLLADPAGAAAFAQFLDKEFASENIRFWWACEQYNATTDLETRRALATDIWERHLADKAPDPVNVDAPAKRATALLLSQSPPELFQQAQKQIFNMLKFDSYQRFLRSGEHAECARADLRGMPLPYDLQHTDPTKLKKSVSNASERRRSGGSSLLPWKTRIAGGRERERNNQTDTQPVTDVVKSSQTTPGQCSLCRVLLPDGATSVVSVDSTVTVGRLVDRLLQRRNLLCTTYDVLFKDGNQAGTRIDPAAPSDILSGREAAVERRCVIRLELRATCLAVRCRGSRRLRHVLRPVLARYAPHAPAGTAAHRALTRDGQIVPLDTLMQELDGARLQIVEVTESGEPRGLDREDDADSLSDLAVRLQDDNHSQQDTQSICGGASRGSRVLTTLRPGPHLHHHPPHFLENLRETQQRLRLQKGETPSTPPASPPATAAPRTPPPLPPKPTHRQAPTVV